MLVFIHSLVFKEKLVSLVCMSGCLCVVHTHACGFQKKLGEGIHHGCGEPNSSPLQEHHVLINMEPALQSPLVITLCYSFKCRHFYLNVALYILRIFFFCLRCFCNVFLKIQISNHCYYEGVLYTNNSSSLPWTQVNTEQWCQLPLSPSLLAPASFRSLTAYSRDSHPKLHGNDGSRNLCFSPKLRRKTVSISYSGWCLMHLDTLAKGKLRS